MGFSTFNPGGPTNIPQFGMAVTGGGGKTCYVHSSGGNGLSELPSGYADIIYTTLNSALAQCRANRGDRVVILEGHVESIATADQLSNLVAGVTIEGKGVAYQRPILRWTAAASTFLFDVDGTVLQNCQIEFCGNPRVPAALSRTATNITVTGIGCAIRHCELNWGVAANQFVSNGIHVNCTDFLFEKNRCIAALLAVQGHPAHATPGFIILNAANRATILDNVIRGPSDDTHTVNGLIQFATAASLDVLIARNTIQNLNAAATCCIHGGGLANTGDIAFNNLAVRVDGGAGTGGPLVFVAAGGDVNLTQNTLQNVANEQGAFLVGTAST